MMSFVALDGVTLFLCWKDITNACKKVCDTVQLLAGFPQCNGGKLEVAEYFKCIFVIYCVLELK